MTIPDSDGGLPNDRLKNFDFASHNAETKQLWESWEKGSPYRVPIIFGLATRFFMMHPEANAKRWTFRQYPRTRT